MQRFEKTNEMLLNCNALSASRLKTAGEDFKKHSKLLGEMKKDLDYIFKKIRIIKTKVSAQYPDAFAAAVPRCTKSSLAEEAEDECETALVAKEFSGGHSVAASDGVHDDPPLPSSSGTASGSAIELPKQQKLLEKKKSLSGTKISIDYVQMGQSPSDGTAVDSLSSGGGGGGGGDPTGKRCSLESNRSTSTDNSNDSSDCTSDTG